MADETLAHKAIFEYIEGWHNTRRRHSSLGYLSPAAYESTCEPATRLAVAWQYIDLVCRIGSIPVRASFTW
jgi:hypothetical protein